MVELSDLVWIMAACDESCSYDLDVPWPLHKALVSLAPEEPHPSLPWWIPLGYVDHAGMGVVGLSDTMDALRATRIFLPESRRPRRFRVDSQALPAARRLLFRLEPAHASAIYRAARIWATASSTVSKNFDTALWSCASQEAVSPLKCLQPFEVR